MLKVIIEVKCGIVVGVFSSNPDVKAIVADFDTQDFDHQRYESLREQETSQGVLFELELQTSSA